MDPCTDHLDDVAKIKMQVLNLIYKVTQCKVLNWIQLFRDRNQYKTFFKQSYGLSGCIKVGTLLPAEYLNFLRKSIKLICYFSLSV